MKGRFFLAALCAAAVAAATSLSTSEGHDLRGCDARAWVRAPDLVPNHILHGDVRVLLNGTHPDCSKVASTQIGLRAKERIVLRFPSTKAEIPKRPVRPKRNETIFDEESYNSLFRFQNWELSSYRDREDSREVEYIKALEAWTEKLKDRTLWETRREETTFFDIATTLTGPYTVPKGVDHFWDSQNAFSIAVPSVNFAAMGTYSFRSYSSSDEHHPRLHHESRIEYYVNVTFANGTSVELPGGITAFVPQDVSLVNKTRQVVATLSRDESSLYNNFDDISTIDTCGSTSINHTIRIDFEGEGISAVQGEALNFNLTIVDQSGDQSLQPLKVTGYLDSKLKHFWAEEVLEKANSTLQQIAMLSYDAQEGGTQQTVFRKEEDVESGTRLRCRLGMGGGRGIHEEVTVQLNQEAIVDQMTPLRSWTGQGKVKLPTNTLPSLSKKYNRQASTLHLTVHYRPEDAEAKPSASDLLQTSLREWWAQEPPSGCSGCTASKGLRNVVATATPITLEILPRHVTSEAFGYTPILDQSKPIDFSDGDARSPIFVPSNAHNLSSDDFPPLAHVSQTRSYENEASKEKLQGNVYRRKACAHAPGLALKWPASECGSADDYVGDAWLRMHKKQTEEQTREEKRKLVFQA